MSEIIYRSMSSEDAHQIRDLYYAYWSSETLAMGVKVEVPRECKQYVDFFLAEIIHNKVSVVAVDSSTSILVGINVCVVSTPDNCQKPTYAPDDENCEKLKKNEEILKQLSPAPDWFEHYDVGSILESRGMYVCPGYGGRGIGTGMFEKSLEIARQLGVKLAVIDSTSCYSRKIFEKLGFHTVTELKLKDVGHLDIPVDSPHQTATLHMKRL